MQFPDPISNIFLGPIPHIFRSNIKHIFRSNTSHFQVQYHTFPTIEDTLFRQDINGKGEATFNMVTSTMFMIIWVRMEHSSSQAYDNDDLLNQKHSSCKLLYHKYLWEPIELLPNNGSNIKSFTGGLATSPPAFYQKLDNWRTFEVYRTHPNLFLGAFKGWFFFSFFWDF